MKDIVIFGASGFGSQIAFVIESINTHSEDWNLLGYLDDDPDKHGEERYGYKVLGGMEWLKCRTHPICVVLGIGYPRVKAAIIEKAEQFAVVSFPTLVHPSAIVCRTTQLGQGVIVCENVVIKTNVKLGDFVILNTASVLGHDSIIDRNASLMPTVNISGDVTVAAGAFIGSNASVLQGLRVGENAVIGGAALVTKDVPDGCTAVGVPAKIIKK